MDLRSAEIFEKNSEYILAAATRSFGIKPDGLIKLGSFESMVYEFERERKNYILKISHSFHRTAAQIAGELDWINYLADNGVPVGRAFPNLKGEIVTRINMDDSYFLAYTFGKSPGAHITADDWGEDLFVKWGRLTGRLHALTKTYKPSDETCQRFHWHEDESLRIEKHVPAEQKLVIDKCHRLFNQLHKLPVGPDNYGLIHSDLYHGNFFVNNGEIIPFDFDDCHYNWFTHDLAMPIFYALRSSFRDDDQVEFTRRFMRAFMDGYRGENQIAPEWLERIPLLLKLREMDLYIIIHAEKAQNLNQWCRDFMDGRREKIENDIPVIDLDFSEFA